jgi:hypothetical protein
MHEFLVSVVLVHALKLASIARVDLLGSTGVRGVRLNPLIFGELFFTAWRTHIACFAAVLLQARGVAFSECSLQAWPG